MRKIGFITSADLSKYRVSSKNSRFTHDDQLACDFLQEHDMHVEPVLWGSDVAKLKSQNFDLLIVRSPWDYAQSEQSTANFLHWLSELKNNNILLTNSYEIMHWNLDKHYLEDLKSCDIKIVQSEFLEADQNIKKIYNFFDNWGSVVIKPCVSAGARDTFLIKSHQELENFLYKFEHIRKQRAFIIQPFIREIQSDGEYSLIFLNEEYSHAVLKKPGAGNWLVQDELGGSVESLEPPKEIKNYAEEVFAKLKKYLKNRFYEQSFLLYARVDILPGLLVGELELVEPELFFLNRALLQANTPALSKFYEGIKILLKKAI